MRLIIFYNATVGTDCVYRDMGKAGPQVNNFLQAPVSAIWNGVTDFPRLPNY